MSVPDTTDEIINNLDIPGTDELGSGEQLYNDNQEDNEDQTENELVGRIILDAGDY